MTIDALDKRLQDVEQMLAHIPQDLDVRFAGLDGRMGNRFDRLGIRLSTVESRMHAIEMTLANLGAKLDVVLQRLPKA